MLLFICFSVSKTEQHNVNNLIEKKVLIAWGHIQSMTLIGKYDDIQGMTLIGKFDDIQGMTLILKYDDIQGMTLIGKFDDIQGMTLTLYGPNSFFHRFSGHNLR